MNIIINKEDISDYQDIHGGACGQIDLTITINPNASYRVNRNLIIHEVIENYFRSVDHSKIEEVCDIIGDALDEL